MEDLIEMDIEMDNENEFLDFVADPYNAPGGMGTVRRYLRDYENPVEFYNDREFKARYRLEKITVMHVLIPLLFPNYSLVNNRGLPIPPLIQLVIALRFYATGNYQIVAGDLHNLSQSTSSRVVQKISSGLTQRLMEFIHFPRRTEDYAENRKLFYSRAQFPGVVGCIDCTHIAIKSPSRATGESFRNRKGWFSLNVQAVSGPRMEFLDIVARWPGSTHDSRIFLNSACRLKFEEKIISGILLGDSGYGQTNYLFTPVLNPANEAQEKYNKAQISTRNVVERLFGVWKRRFPCLRRKLENKLSNTTNIIVACAILHNLCITANDQHFGRYEGINIPVNSAVQSASGRMIRDAFIQRHFT